MPGPVPKREGQRRRRNKPESQKYGLDTPQGASTAPETLGFDAHTLVESLWTELRTSVEGNYYSPADWQRVRLELFYINSTLMSEKIGAQAWTAIQSGMNDMLVSPAEKRRVGIELQGVKVDVDEDAAVAQMDDYRARLGG